ncbi:WhiB family transcriptional regulator [Nonomuraea sp. PA05]|nr:WhiB family transcriptional regulator [Nonomuraea sp. PA05]
MDAETFFPVGNTGYALIQAAEAKQVCGSCSVVAACLDWALTMGETGIWGGKTEEERKSLKRSLQRRARAETAVV